MREQREPRLGAYERQQALIPPTQTALAMLQQLTPPPPPPSPFPFTGVTSQQAGIEPPILPGNTVDARVRWASGLGTYNDPLDMPDPRAVSWFRNMMGGPWQSDNPWGSNYQNAGSNKGGTAYSPTGPDFNIISGKGVPGHRANQ